MKKTKKITQIALYGALGLIFLIAGVLYSRYARDGIEGVWNIRELLSQSVDLESKDAVPTSPTVTLSKEQITARISELEKEILSETNNPDRDLELRRELYTIKQQLQNMSQ